MHSGHFTKRYNWSLTHVGSLWTGPVTKPCFGTVLKRKEKAHNLLAGSFLSLVCPWSMFVPWRFNTLPAPVAQCFRCGEHRERLNYSGRRVLWPPCVSCSCLHPTSRASPYKGGIKDQRFHGLRSQEGMRQLSESCNVTLKPTYFWLCLDKNLKISCVLFESTWIFSAKAMISV